MFSSLKAFSAEDMNAEFVRSAEFYTNCAVTYSLGKVLLNDEQQIMTVSKGHEESLELALYIYYAIVKDFDKAEDKAQAVYDLKKSYYKELGKLDVDQLKEEMSEDLTSCEDKSKDRRKILASLKAQFANVKNENE